MTTFKLKGFESAMRELSHLEDALPTHMLAPVIEEAKAALSAASKASGGVGARPDDFKAKLVRKGPGYADGRITGRGFAVLDEMGSYKKPHGYDIEPSYGIGRGIYGKNRAILGNKKSGFAAAYVHHPAQKPHPYVAAAERVIGQLVEKSANAAQLAALAKVRLY